MKNFLILSLFAIVIGCSPYGSRMDFGKAELYYKEPATAQEAKKLGDYFMKIGFFGPKQMGVQLTKVQETLQIRMAIKKDYIAVSEPLFKPIVNNVSMKVFPNKKLELHFCNKAFKTQQVIHPLSVAKFGKVRIFYHRAVTKKEVQKLGQHFKQGKYASALLQDVLFKREHTIYKVYFVVMEKFLEDETVVAGYKKIAQKISSQVFPNTLVQFFIIDSALQKNAPIPLD